VTEVVHVLSSMATRLVLADLAAEASARHGMDVRVTSLGGVEAARRVREGHGGDVVVLAEDAVAALAADGHLTEQGIRPLFRSEVAVAAASQGATADVGTTDGLRRALRESARIAYSTGPSGEGLLALLRSWGMWDEIAERLVQAPPGVPVGTLLLEGHADLGFQQFSELREVDGIEVLGLMPPGAEITTVFAGALAAGSSRPVAARAVLDGFGARGAAPLVRSRGMELVETPIGTTPEDDRTPS